MDGDEVGVGGHEGVLGAPGVSDDEAALGGDSALLQDFDFPQKFVEEQLGRGGWGSGCLLNPGSQGRRGFRSGGRFLSPGSRG